MKQQFEVWASPEPTVARVVAPMYRDQLAETGHADREGDLDLLSGLGVQAARYPVLWERHAPSSPKEIDLEWAVRRLQRMDELQIEPIVTLLHHGSGPRYTSLIDENFPELFADYARRVAATFPKVKRWTPVNEPTTTARFSTLYGTWYPNGMMNHEAFGQAMTNQALATTLAMHEIRKHNADAQLVVTDDLQSFTAGDDQVRDYVRHKSERMYLSIEFLMGRVKAGHPLWKYLTETCKVPEPRLRRLRECAIAPDLIGWNYYPNSERYLETDRNGSLHNIARIDIAGEQLDPRPLLLQAYQRCRIPLAFSEIHVNGTAEDRVHWLLDRYEDACAVHEQGVHFRALGLWAAFGLVDWQSLLRRCDGAVEDGIYRFASGNSVPQATILADAVRSLARGEVPERPKQPAWWKRAEYSSSRKRLGKERRLEPATI